MPVLDADQLADTALWRASTLLSVFAHSFVRVEVTNKEGKTETWNLEWGSSTQLSAAKFPVTRTSLKFGDRIIATGEPGRDAEAHRIRIFSIKRPVDGWEWQGVVE